MHSINFVRQNPGSIPRRKLVYYSKDSKQELCVTWDHGIEIPLHDGIIDSPTSLIFHCCIHGKNGFVTATKLGTTGQIFVAATKNFAAANQTFC